MILFVGVSSKCRSRALAFGKQTPLDIRRRAGVVGHGVALARRRKRLSRDIVDGWVLKMW
jgi:hypothetical protein